MRHLKTLHVTMLVWTPYLTSMHGVMQPTQAAMTPSFRADDCNEYIPLILSIRQLPLTSVKLVDVQAINIGLTILTLLKLSHIHFVIEYKRVSLYQHFLATQT